LKEDLISIDNEDDLQNLRKSASPWLNVTHSNILLNVLKSKNYCLILSGKRGIDSYSSAQVGI
jgi:electron transfer flavoprotein alpha/beta subunit